MPFKFDSSPIILASKSPRRRELLDQAGLSFSVVPSQFDESSVAFSEPETYVTTLAEAKAGEVSEVYPDSWVLGADTIVVIDGDLLEKPRSANEAHDMLRRLSGRWHRVFTGYCVCCIGKKGLFSGALSTRVEFNALSHEQIEWYIQTGEPFDKAGGYAIQGRGTLLVKNVIGSYTNVVGLPVCEVMDLLMRENIISLDQLDNGG